MKSLTYEVGKLTIKLLNEKLREGWIYPLIPCSYSGVESNIFECDICPGALKSHGCGWANGINQIPVTLIQHEFISEDINILEHL